ncbi:MAG: hypothetical protein HYX59_11235 [Elusimicrobia bacterium]|nr:hypothetical protein [Elusimicrobiota bacterium]
MRPLLALAVILALSPASLSAQAPAAASAQADWRRDGVDDRVKAGLTSLGWRLEDDGRALDPKTKAPVTKAVLDKAVLDLRQGARRAALETVNLMLSTGKPLQPEDRSKIETLAADLPPGLADAILDPASDMNKVKAMADAGLARVADYFEGSRTLADRQAAAQPVSAGTPGPRVDLPYYTASERSVGEKIQASARAEIGRDPFGKTVLSRLNVDGKPDLPPFVIEDQSNGVVAQYDYRRRAVVLDREAVLASVVGTVPPRQASALRASLSTRAALMSYLDSQPEAVAAVVKDNDAVIVHELTHAWQDRRDPIFREMARGNIPDVQPLEYEEEAYKTKNLYLRSKLKNDPVSVKMNDDLVDYEMMTNGVELWEQGLFDGIEGASPSRAIPLKGVRAIEAARLERVRNRAVTTSEEQRAKALDLQALTRGNRQLTDLESAHAKRMAALNPSIENAQKASYRDLGNYYLVQALRADRAPDRSTYLDRAETYAKASGNKALIEEVLQAKEKKQ